MGLIQEFQKADEERRREIKQLQDEVSTFVKDLVKGSVQRRSEVANMFKDLAKGDTERRSEVAAIVEAADSFVKDLGKGSAQRRSDIATMVRDFTAQAQGRQAEVATIAQEATAIVKAADTFVKDLAKGSAERASEVGKVRSEVATMFKDLAKRDTERRSEVAAIHEMVWGKEPTRKKVAPVVAALPRKVSPAAPVAEQAPAGELRDKVFAYLANHPDGTRLTELEEEFGVARIQTARVVRELMDTSKVEKRDLLYFTI